VMVDWIDCAGSGTEHTDLPAQHSRKLAPSVRAIGIVWCCVAHPCAPTDAKLFPIHPNGRKIPSSDWPWIPATTNNPGALAVCWAGRSRALFCPDVFAVAHFTVDKFPALLPITVHLHSLLSVLK
jgi:hypothetical protein